MIDDEYLTMGRAGLIRASARVVAAAGDAVWVEAEAKSACGGCAAASNCGVSALSGSLGRKAARLKLRNLCDARIGDRVVIGIPQSTLLRASITVYLTPLIAMIVAAAAAVAAGGGDGVAALSGFGGLAAGFLAAKLIADGALGGSLQPVFMARADRPGAFLPDCKLD